jgi:chloride channel 7
MIHIGAVVGAGISQGWSPTLRFKWDALRRILTPFRNDLEKRDFIASGASAGLKYFLKKCGV